MTKANINDTLYQSPDMWLLNLGYVSENSEQNLLLYGYISTRGVVNVELLLDVENWLIKYAVVLGGRSYFMYNTQKKLECKSGLWSKLKLLCFLKFFGSNDPVQRIRKCVKDYAGSSWKTQIEVMSVKQYNKIAESGNGTKSWFFETRVNKDRPVRND